MELMILNNINNTLVLLTFYAQQIWSTNKLNLSEQENPPSWRVWLQHADWTTAGLQTVTIKGLQLVPACQKRLRETCLPARRPHRGLDLTAGLHRLELWPTVDRAVRSMFRPPTLTSCQMVDFTFHLLHSKWSGPQDQVQGKTWLDPSSNRTHHCDMMMMIDWLLMSVIVFSWVAGEHTDSVIGCCNTLFWPLEVSSAAVWAHLSLELSIIHVVI